MLGQDQVGWALVAVGYGSVTAAVAGRAAAARLDRGWQEP